MARINSEISNRIIALRFPLIVGVVLIHAEGSIVNFSEGKLGLQSLPYPVFFLEELVGNVFSRVAVPLFFLISSFLLFSNYKPTLQSYTEKLRSRTRTLLIPYIIWSTITLLALRAAQSIPMLSQYFSGGSVYSVDVKHLNWFQYLDLFLGLTRPPIAYPFWFIRDLFILVILSPIVLYLAKRAALITLTICFVLWFLQFDILPIPSSTSIFFFFLGALWSVQQISVKQFDRLEHKIIPIYLVMAIIDAASKNSTYGLQLHAITILIGIAFFWVLAGKLANNQSSLNTLAKLSSFSFFVYAAHAPVLTVTKKVVYQLLVPNNATEIALLYFLAPTVTILICLGAAILLRSKLPAFYNIATGGR